MTPLTGSLPPEGERGCGTLHEFQEARTSLRRAISASRNWGELVMVKAVTLIARLLVCF